MGLLGKWIDAATDEERDRVIEAQAWRAHYFKHHDGTMCLVGHMANGDSSYFSYETMDTWTRRHIRLGQVGIGDQFDLLCDRFGLPRVVRAIKLRAGKPQPVLPQTAQRFKLQHYLTTTAGE